ncbi:hypothetical protein ACJRO7_003531 [Eucalyptus globulus]|uniref:Histone deacetylase domain-containing protein n=1 Tax=Eucalyptus globulus TaxID=34317 RepID=A0ABD3IWZ6_EUCGL
MAASSSPSMNRFDAFWHDGMLNPTWVGASIRDPDSVRNMVSILKRGSISPFISWHNATPALISQLLSFHSTGTSGSQLGKVLCCGTFLGTFLEPCSWDTELLAVGNMLSTMKHILNSKGCHMRPPGHHAQPSQANGYCLLNNAGLAVRLALDSWCKSVVIRSNDVVTMSLHINHWLCGPSHPQSGCEMRYKYAMTELVVLTMESFKPEMVFLVVGQNSSVVSSLADRHSGGRILIVQEGEYHPEGFLDLPDPLSADPVTYYPEDEAFPGTL